MKPPPSTKARTTKEIIAEAEDEVESLRVQAEEINSMPALEECHKAEQNVLMINTPLGKKQLIVPNTAKEVKESPESEQ